MLIRDTKQLGAALQRERKRQGLTQKQLANKAGLRQPTVSAIENGKPRSELQVVFGIMAALKVDMLLTARDSQNTPIFEELF